MGNNGTGVHEMMHALGFYHEQSRPDRDSNVKVMMWNVKVHFTRKEQLTSWGRAKPSLGKLKQTRIGINKKNIEIKRNKIVKNDC